MHIPSSGTIILLFAGLRFVFMFDVPFTPCRNIGKANYIFRPERPNPLDRKKRLPRPRDCWHYAKDVRSGAIQD